jgi:hypothetical protein
MQNLKLLVTKNDTWSNSEGENEGIPFLIRFRPHLQKFEQSKKFNYRVLIEWNYNSKSKSQMPDDIEINSMRKFENSLVKHLENDLQAVLSFVYTGGGRREWNWYSQDINLTQDRLDKVLSTLGPLPVKIMSFDEPNWDEYNDVLRSVE